MNRRQAISLLLSSPLWTYGQEKGSGASSHFALTADDPIWLEVDLTKAKGVRVRWDEEIIEIDSEEIWKALKG